MNIEECIRRADLQPIPSDRELADKEFREAVADLQTARKSLRLNDFKWCIVSAYYACFHAAKGVLFLNGLKEKAHYAIKVALQEWGETGKVPRELAADFSACLHARESADYHYAYSKETAASVLHIAEEFVAAMHTYKSKRLQ